MQSYRRALPVNNPASTRNRRDPTGQGRQARFGPDDADRAQITPATPRVSRRREGHAGNIRGLDASTTQSLDSNSTEYRRAVARGTRANQSQAAVTIQQAYRARQARVNQETEVPNDASAFQVGSAVSTTNPDYWMLPRIHLMKLGNNLMI